MRWGLGLESWGLSVLRSSGLIGGVKRSRKIVLIALAICAAAFVCALWPRQREPMYEGKPLSRWLVSEYRHYYGREPENGQTAAILAIGTNALPFLTKWMQLTVRPWTKRMFGFVPDVTALDTRQTLADASLHGFYVLGPRGSAAIPELTQLMRATNCYIAMRALVCVEYTGAAGIPVVLDVLTNRQGYCPDNVFSLFGTMQYLGTNANLIIPGLIDCLRLVDGRPAANAAILLGEIKRQPATVVPALVRSAKDSDQDVRYCAIHSLGRFQGEARAAVPTLLDCLRDPVLDVREVATNSLYIIEGKALGEPLDK